MGLSIRLQIDTTSSSKECRGMVSSKFSSVFSNRVETIGDAYVAVCGLPNPNEKHAEIMARFAARCLERFAKLTKYLEIRLGPSTGDLTARVGLHSGPITAGT